MDIKDMVKDAKPMTLEYMRHLLSKGRGANPSEVASLVHMVLAGAGAQPAAPAPKPKPKVKAKNASPAPQAEPAPEDD